MVGKKYFIVEHDLPRVLTRGSMIQINWGFNPGRKYKVEERKK